MKVLIDTHILVWADIAPERLGSAQSLLADADRRLLSAVSTWELAIKQSLAKVDLALDIRSWYRRALSQLSAEPLPITLEHTAAVEHLPAFHADPFDRLLIAQAQQESAVLITADRALVPYGEVVHLIR